MHHRNSFSTLIPIFLCLFVSGCQKDSVSPGTQTIAGLDGWYRANNAGDTLSQASHYYGYFGYFPDGVFTYLELGFNNLSAQDSTLFQVTWLDGIWKGADGILTTSRMRKATAYNREGLEKYWQAGLTFGDTLPGGPKPLPYRLSGDTLFLSADSLGAPAVMLKTVLPTGVHFSTNDIRVEMGLPILCGLGDTLLLRASVTGDRKGAEYAWRLPGQNSFSKTDSPLVWFVAPRKSGKLTAVFRVKAADGQTDMDSISIRVKPLLSNINEDSTVTVDLDRVFDGDTSSLPHSYAILDSSKGAVLALSGSRLTIDPDQDFDGSLAIILRSTGKNGANMVDTLKVHYVAINDPPRLVSPQADTNIVYFDSLVVDVASRFRDPEGQSMAFGLTLDSRISAGLVNGKLTVRGGGSVKVGGGLLGVVTVRISSSDGMAVGDSLAFQLDLNGPMPSGRKVGMPVELVANQGSQTSIFLESTGRNLTVLLSSPLVFLDQEGRVAGLQALPGKLYQEWGFRDSTVFSSEYSSTVADSIRWVTFTKNGSERRGFGFEAGGTLWGANIAYFPARSMGGGDFLFVKQARVDTFGVRNVYALERWSAGLVSPVAMLPLPDTLSSFKVRPFGEGFVCFWSTRIDSTLSTALYARYFSAAGIPSSPVVQLSTYASGSLPGHRRNSVNLVDAIPFNGNLDVYTTTANILEKPTQQQTIGDIDHAAFRTVFGPGFSMVSKQTLPPDAYLGAYASMYRTGWHPLDATRYRLQWSTIGYSGSTSMLAGITVNTAGGIFSEASQAAAATGSADFRFSGGNVLRFSNGFPRGSAEILR